MWRSLIRFHVYAAFAVLVCADIDSLVVNIESGPVRGYRHPIANLYEFLEIPYATAPTGINKFGPPLEAPKWSEIREAVETGIECPQGNEELRKMPRNMTMNENCLVASVFVPNTYLQKLPVVVYVHGGAFQRGSGNILKPIELVNEHRIIAVTFNYRLGIQGFLCLGTEDVPGNAGMKDQVALLRWVKKNIASFGGNPDDVTIAGRSAGSASVDLLMLSRSTSGLFNKVIPESGANVGVWTIQSDPVETAKWFAKALNFDNVDDIYALEQFYKTASWEQLISDTFSYRADSTFVFSPCVERPLTSEEIQHGKEVFLDESPTEILRNEKYTKVPVLYGFANMEGLYRIENFEEWKMQMNEKFSDFLPADLTFVDEEEKENVAKKIKEFYFGDKPVNNDNVLKYVDYFTDILFAFPVLRSTKLHVEKGHDQIYLYEYNFVDENTSPVPHTDIRGAPHCAQSNAVLTGPSTIGFSELTEEYQKLTFDLRQIWANFIKTGKPVPEGSDLPSWPAVSSNWSPHMSLGNVIELKGSLLLERALFWEDIYNKYYREPVQPLISHKANVNM